MTLLVWCTAALIAYTIKGFSGFGPALVVVPVLSVLYSPATALGTSALVDAVVGACFIAYLGLSMAQLKMLRRMLASLVIGTVIGSMLVAYIPRQILLILVGLSVLGLAIQLLRTGKPGFTVSGRQMPLQLSCFLAGLSGGLVGVSGPFMVAGTARFEKAEMRRLLVAVFLVEGIVRIATYAFMGTIEMQSLELGAIALPAIVLGMVLGIWLHTRVSEKRFITVIAWFLMAVAIQPLASALS
ncbi:sulfite exporter TauE/SafE family protein [Cryobacterium sp. Y11]|uniref:sulfite exporter TauE/SafE family protein n=1 Tax=Cryobacterium sp. Y11 TaxID=2045016 RepID=UPI000CE43433|nr:sulfite exporter TauE/SafE family protein [Cryobacterium sp. Y11]